MVHQCALQSMCLNTEQGFVFCVKTLLPQAQRLGQTVQSWYINQTLINISLCSNMHEQTQLTNGLVIIDKRGSFDGLFMLNK